MWPRPRERFAGREIHVNEVVGEDDQYLPAENLGYLHYMERGGADAAARACWPANDGESNCYNDSLAGLLVPETSQPRSVWWAHPGIRGGRQHARAHPLQRRPRGRAWPARAR